MIQVKDNHTTADSIQELVKAGWRVISKEVIEEGLFRVLLIDNHPSRKMSIIVPAFTDFDLIRANLSPEAFDALQALGRLEKCMKDFSGCFRDLPAEPLVDKAREIMKGTNV